MPVAPDSGDARDNDLMREVHRIVQLHEHGRCAK
jgi:hypothetical protein